MKMNQWASVPCIALCSAVLATIPGCSEKQAMTRPATFASQETATQAITKPAEARDLLLHMAEYLAQKPRFSVNIRSAYDVVQESGQKIEFEENRKVTIKRPDFLRVESVQSDGDKHIVLYDGEDITTFNPSQNVYAQVSKPGDIDEAITYFLKDLHMRLPLAMLLLSRFPDELERRTQSLDYVEQAEIQGKPAHHLAGRTETVDYQVWIAAGAQPLILRAVLTYKNAEGQPQFRAQFTDWNFSPEIQDSQFTFVPPEGARKIAFLAQLPQGSTPTKQAGELK